MRDRDKLIELLCNKFINSAVDWVREKVAKIADHLIANGVTVNEWRPASEPPKKSGAYLTTKKSCGKLYYEVCRFANSLAVVDEEQFNDVAGWYDCDEFGYYLDYDVLYWMPLPELPKEVE